MRLLVLALLLLAPAAAYEPVEGYDPARDAAADIDAAAEEAARTNRFVLLEIGGKWCIWCRYLDEFLASHDEVRKDWEETFVVVKVNFSEENKNEDVLGRYPEIPGYPHFFILGPDGQFLESQGTAELEEGKSYDPKIFQAFIDSWAVRRPKSSQ